MVLRGMRYKNWASVMELFLAVSYAKLNEYNDKIYFNSYRVSDYLATKNVYIEPKNVSRCLATMVRNNHMKVLYKENKAPKIVTKRESKQFNIKKLRYLESNVYGEIDLKAINEELKIYQYGSRMDMLANPQALYSLWVDYAKFCKAVKEGFRNEIKIESALKSKVNLFCLDLLEDVNTKLPMPVSPLPEKPKAKDKGMQITYLREGKLRGTNPVCPTINPENYDPEEDNHNDTERKDSLIPYLGENYEHIDVNASIIRLHKDLVNDTITPFYKYDDAGNIIFVTDDDGNIKPVDDDIYERIYNRTPLKDKLPFRKKITQEWFEITGKKDKKISVRKLIKKLTLPTYMREWTYGNAAGKYNNEWGNLVWSGYEDSLAPEDLKTYRLYECLEKLFGYSIYAIRYMWLKAMHDELAHQDMGCTNFLQSEIFIYETNLHILMLKQFQDMGIKVINVYDCFYFPKGAIDHQLFFQIYCECLTQLKDLMRQNAEPVEDKLDVWTPKDFNADDYKKDESYLEGLLKWLDEQPVDLSMAEYYNRPEETPPFS